MTTISATQNLKATLDAGTLPDSARKLSDRLPRKWRAAMVVTAAAVAALIPIFIWGIPVGPDLSNHYRFAVAFHDSLLGGKLYPGWLGPTNFGYGDARLRFYPPGLYFLLSTARLLTGWYSATILTFCLLSIVGALGVYFWSRSLCSTQNAMWAGIIYAFAPYHLNQIYRAAMLAEYAACSVLPFAFAFVDRICRKGKAVDIAGLALAFALLILLNLPLTLIGSFSLVAYALLRIRREVFWRTLMKLALAGLTALAATAFFWSTVVAELPWIKGNKVDPNIYYDYHVNFLFSSSNLTNYGAWHTNLLGVVTIAFLLPALIFVRRSLFTKQSDTGLRAVFLMALISLLMATEVSRPVWAIIPKLRDVQFPWRWLGITSMFGSILLAASIPRWAERLKGSFRPRDLAVAFALGLSVFFVAYQVIWDAEYLQGQEFDSKFPKAPGLSFKDWLPVAAKDLTQVRKMSSDVEADSRVVTIKSWGPEYRTFRVSNGPSEEARVRTYYYPLWTATAQGAPLSLRAAEDGAILIAIPSGETNVELAFREPPRVATARIVSGCGWMLIASMFAFGPASRLRLRLGSKRSPECVDSASLPINSLP